MPSKSAARLKELFDELGLADRVTQVGDNVWTVRKGSATVQVVATPEFVIATARVADRPPQKGREAFYRMLLASNVELLGAFFTLEADESIRINQLLPVEWLQAKELGFILGNVATKADDWDDRLRALTE